MEIFWIVLGCIGILAFGILGAMGSVSAYPNRDYSKPRKKRTE